MARDFDDFSYGRFSLHTMKKKERRCTYLGSKGDVNIELFGLFRFWDGVS